ncbi:MAG: hypothetical protein CMM43_00360 [Rhodospirillaceae bacterium]|nr:hypothetical protein [Rhodospirillaceae bacterium]|tara:strand:+ start:3300 stop:3707 length:408 start_codon:yes stop_codon:yes gene_type:complete
MHDKQTIMNLLNTIRDVLDQDIFPNLSANQLETAKMTRSGLDIVIRRLTKSSETISDPKIQEMPLNTSHSFLTNNKNSKYKFSVHELAKDIREGKYDDNLLGPILEELEEQVCQRLELSNPEYLSKQKFTQPNVI